MYVRLSVSLRKLLGRIDEGLSYWCFYHGFAACKWCKRCRCGKMRVWRVSWAQGVQWVSLRVQMGPEIEGSIIESSLVILEGFGFVETFEEVLEVLEAEMDGFVWMIELPVSIFLSTIETEIRQGSWSKIWSLSPSHTFFFLEWIPIMAVLRPVSIYF